MRSKYELEIILKTHCGGCGMCVVGRMMQNVPHEETLINNVARLKSQVDNWDKCPRCAVTLPKIETQWFDPLDRALGVFT